MGKQSGVIEKESLSFANERKSHQSKHFSPGPLNIAGAKGPDADKLLEHTLVNSTGIGETLTRREAEIMRLVVAGKSNKEISHILCRTQRTIEYHRNRLMHKLKVHNVAGLVKRAIAMGVA